MSTAKYKKCLWCGNAFEWKFPGRFVKPSSACAAHANLYRPCKLLQTMLEKTITCVSTCCGFRLVSVWLLFGFTRTCFATVSRHVVLGKQVISWWPLQCGYGLLENQHAVTILCRDCLECNSKFTLECLGVGFVICQNIRQRSLSKSSILVSKWHVQNEHCPGITFKHWRYAVTTLVCIQSHTVLENSFASVWPSHTKQTAVSSFFCFLLRSSCHWRTHVPSAVEDFEVESKKTIRFVRFLCVGAQTFRTQNERMWNWGVATTLFMWIVAIPWHCFGHATLIYSERNKK